MEQAVVVILFVILDCKGSKPLIYPSMPPKLMKEHSNGHFLFDCIFWHCETLHLRVLTVYITAASETSNKEAAPMIEQSDQAINPDRGGGVKAKADKS